jgi:hypothetical protein
MAKVKAISLGYSRIGNTYEVQQITNSSLLKPGDWINPDYAKALNDHPDWTVVASPIHLSMPIDPLHIISIIPALL